MKFSAQTICSIYTCVMSEAGQGKIQGHLGWKSLGWMGRDLQDGGTTRMVKDHGGQQSDTQYLASRHQKHSCNISWYHLFLSLSLFWFDINIYQISCPCCYNSFLRTSWASTSTSRSLKESFDFGNYFIFWNSSGCPKDPENPRKRLYKIFEGNKHSSLGPKITLFRTIISVFEARVPLRWAISCEPRRVFQRTKRCARRWLIALLEQKLILRVLPTNSLRRMLERIRGWSQRPSQKQRRQSYVWCGYVIGFKHVQTRCSGIG